MNSPRRTWPDRLVLVVLLGLLLLGLVQIAVAETWWPGILLTYLPQLPLLTPAGILLAMAWPKASRSGRRGIALGLVVIGFGFSGFQTPRPRQLPAGQAVRVVTYNMLHGRRGIGPVLDLIERSRPDVLCLQEADALDGQKEPLDYLMLELAGWQVHRAGDVAILSPHPLSERQTIDLMPLHYGAFVAATVTVGERRLTICTVHLFNGLGPKHLRGGWRKLPGRVSEAARIREAELERLLARLPVTPGPMIVCGDFNMPPAGKLWARMRSRFRDGFAEAGWGLGYTFRADLPAVRIDYVWCGDGVAVRACAPLPHDGGDHRPVVADLVLAAH